ncbi:MAG: PspA/IM30 family protein [Chloroflexi bacterium]|jgi:chromosome segregation ATPase|nr:PspA/IM30 family protein [Chloroflexota bacterium]
MSDLLEKLNVLLRASLSSLTSSGAERSSIAPIPPERLGAPKELDREIAALRKRLADAIAQQEALQARIEDMERQIDEYIRQADSALLADDEPRARYLIAQKQRLEQRVRAQSEMLTRYRNAAAELMEQVNRLEALVADARRAAAESAAAPLSENPPSRAPALADVLRSVRERVEETFALRPKPPSDDLPPAKALPSKPSPSPFDDDDLARRRARLSLPD